jgi:multicomponent Na+:H+ antiporter subunit E
MKFKNTFILFVVLLLIWLALNNSLKLQVVLIGVGVSAIVALLFCEKCTVFTDMKLNPKAIAYTFIYLVVFFIELVKSNIDVTRRVLSPSLPINPGIVEVKTKLKSKFGRMLLANSITLTPGTLTVEVIDDSYFIHWINVEDAETENASKKIVEKFEKYLEVIYG